MKLRIALLEDEESDREQTAEYLERFFRETNTEYELTCFAGAEEFLKDGISKFQDTHLLILDILLRGGRATGVDLAREVRRYNRDIAIMFVTKTAQFAINGYEVDAVDYVLKPLVYEDFAFKLKKAVKFILLRMEKFIRVDHRNGTSRVSERSIYYVEVIKHYLMIHTVKEVLVARGTMRDLEGELSESFSRCSNSFIVNLRHVDGVYGSEVIVQGTRIPITKSYRASFLRAFNAYTGVM